VNHTLLLPRGEVEQANRAIGAGDAKLAARVLEVRTRHFEFARSQLARLVDRLLRSDLQ
jgi:hypothetical protein